MQILRPFKVGDYVPAGGIEGTVREMGLFGTTILTPDNVVTVVGNNKTFRTRLRICLRKRIEGLIAWRRLPIRLTPRMRLRACGP